MDSEADRESELPLSEAVAAVPLLLTLQTLLNDSVRKTNSVWIFQRGVNYFKPVNF